MIGLNYSSGLNVGVITHDRSTLFGNLLVHLKIAVEYAHSEDMDFGKCSLIVVNNSGPQSHDAVQKIIDDSGIEKVCTVKIVDSSENNIAVGRNLVLDNSSSRWLVFIDDDEYPNPDWICRLYYRQQISGNAVVAGPIEPVYPEGTTGWVAAVDLHNKGSLKSGDELRRVATGNCLLDMEQIGSQRFDPEFGLSGGSDGLFFEELSDRGLYAVWQEDAIVHETIPRSRTSSKYMIFRCMTQGHNFKRVVQRNARFSQRFVFIVKAMVVAPVSLFVGTLTLPVNERVSAYWLKRGFTNLGKLIRPSRRLYG